MDPTARAWQILEAAELIHSAAAVDAAIARVAAEISATLKDRYPLVLLVMGGAVVFAGRILPMLNFPLDFDYIHASRYGGTTSGGPVDWKVEPKGNVSGRVVLVLDDILDMGIDAIRQRLKSPSNEAGTAVLSAAEWEREFDTWLESFPDTVPLPDEALSRENLYPDRL